MRVIIKIDNSIKNLYQNFILFPGRSAIHDDARVVQIFEAYDVTIRQVEHE